MWPWPNRIAGGSYKWKDKVYQIPLSGGDEHALHGLISHAEFELIDQASDLTSASIRLRHVYTGHNAGYPWPAEIYATYTLDAEGISLLLEATNLGISSAPMALGWHPYFSLEGQLVDEWRLSGSIKSHVLAEALIPTGELAPTCDFETNSPLLGRAFDDGYLLHEHESQMHLSIKDSELSIALSSMPGTQPWRYVQLYTPPDRRSLAIEPMTAAADAFNNGFGLIEVPPNEALKMGIRLSVNNGVRTIG